MSNRIIIVGGGASGMMAAIIARRKGSEVTILERNDRVGKKLLATGNGRCNYTNENINLNFFHGEDKEFIRSVLDRFTNTEVIEFFESLGIVPAVEDNGKVFPLSFQSSSMLDVLRYEMQRLNIKLETESYVVKITKDKSFNLYTKDGRNFKADKIIIATGGMAMPVSGSDGNGYSIAQTFMHVKNEPTPALVQLKLIGDKWKQINGVKFIGKASLIINDKYIADDIGDILFTDYGVSGPPILQLSREAIKAKKEGKSVKIGISILHNKTKKEVFEYLKERFQKMPEKTLEESLIGMINKRLILPIIKELGMDKDKHSYDINEVEVSSLAEILVNWEFELSGDKGWGHAQTTAGGISLEKINPDTMESKIVEGLFLCGELLDVDGDCGGYNLQWAWSSGYIAGSNAGYFDK
ncbi:MAG: NAD(P)/FAD-dependent oxidoreductase [Gudongella sp.]|nr:NAD(P)/FAD-dependent oxidoreductase [Gudongella sp.]